MKITAKKIVFSALLAALTCVFTTVTKIPIWFAPGYINMGDCVVLLCGWLTSPVYAFLAAGVGSALADLISGYAVYAPVTFLIKGLVALTAYYGFKRLSKKFKKGISKALSGVLAELVMILGYFVFESFLYGIEFALLNIPANAVQGAYGIMVGIILAKTFEKVNLN